jgi:hypothetical protein
VPEPADRCPYHRPFQEDFTDCRAYLPTQFIPLDTRHRPMRPAWTCWNLVVRRRPERPGSFYAGCRIGDAEARRRWVQALDARRVEMMRSLRRQFIDASESEFAGFWAAKAEAVGAAAGQRRAAEDALRSPARRLHYAFDSFFAAHDAALEALGLARALSMEIVDAWLAILVARESGEADWRLPAELVERLPPSARGFYAWNSDSSST